MLFTSPMKFSFQYTGPQMPEEQRTNFNIFLDLFIEYTPREFTFPMYRTYFDGIVSFEWVADI